MKLTTAIHCHQLPSTVFNCRQPLLTAANLRQWPLNLGIFCLSTSSSWQRLAAVDNGWWQLMMVDEVDHCHQLWSTAANCCQLPPVDNLKKIQKFDGCWQWLAAVENSWRQLMTVHSSWPGLKAAVNCHEPSSTAVNHWQLPPTFVNRHQI